MATQTLASSAVSALLGICPTFLHVSVTLRYVTQLCPFAFRRACGRLSADVLHMGSFPAINIDTQLSSSDGQSVLCRASNCPADQAYDSPTDYAADRNSPLGQTFTHTFCP